MKRIVTCIFIIVMMVNCSKDAPAPKSDLQINPPAKVVLSYPAQNSACTESNGSGVEGVILFKWNSAELADSYEINIKNLNNEALVSKTTNNTELEISLPKNTPYSWFVVSKSSKTTETSQSDIWRFYNAGPGAVSYAPFPAEAVSPTHGQALNVSTGVITLDWTGDDPDKDISSYDVYFGTNSSPSLLKSNNTESILANVTVNANTNYYWKIVTKDKKGNSATSNIFEFKIN